MNWKYAWLHTVVVLAPVVALSTGTTIAKAQDEAEGALEAEAGGEAEAGAETDLSVGLEGETDLGVGGAEEPADAPAAPAAAPMGDEEEIVVTGSHIKRTSYSTPSPVQVLDRESLEKTGADSMADVVSNLAISNGAATNAGVGTGARGSAQFNLRGLGAQTVLVLVNGRRLLTSGLTSAGQPFTDVEQIPLTMVERIEIMKGGASAIYGSDAISGVVNIILRRKYDGVRLEAGGSIETRSGTHREGDVAMAVGASNDTSGINLTVSYKERTGLNALDRAYTEGDPDRPPQQGPVIELNPNRTDERVPTNVSSSGSPGSYVLVGGIPDAFTDRDGNPPPADAQALVRFVPDPECTNGTDSFLVNEPERVEMREGAPVLFFTGQRCGFSFNKYYNLVLPERKLNAYLQADHDFTNHFGIFAEAGYYRLNVANTLSPSFPLAKEVTVPASHPNFPTTPEFQGAMGDIRWVGRTRGGDFPPSRQSTRQENFRWVAGLRGDFADVGEGTALEGWDWEASVTQQTAYITNTATDDLTQELQRSLNACPPTTSIDQDGDPMTDDGVTVANPDNGVIPCYDPFYDPGDPLGARNQEAFDYFTGSLVGRTTRTMWVGDAVLRGPLVELPGGDMSFAVGAQYRREELQLRSDAESNQERYLFLVGTPGYAIDQDIFGAYGELVFPIAEGLELQAAARYENYQDVGSSVNPKVGLSFQPFITSGSPGLERLRLRASVATAFRGPSLLQLGGRQVTLTEFRVGGAPVFKPARTSGNPNLDNENSLAASGGIEWGVEGLDLSTDFWYFRYEDIVAEENPQLIWNLCQETGPDPMDPACSRVEVGDAGELVAVNTMFVNAPSVTTYGLDFGGTYRFGLQDFGSDSDIGTFNVGVDASYIISYKGKDPTGTRPDEPIEEKEYAGSRNFNNFANALPNLRMSIPVGWGYSGHHIQFVGRYIGSFTDDQNPQVDAMDEPIPGTEPEIPAWFVLDAQYGYRLEDVIGTATTFSIGVTNLLDEDPPFVQTSLGYEINQHDPRGRVVYGRITQDF